MKFRFNNSGLTLVEFLVYFTIATMIALALFAILTSFWQTRSQVYFGNRLLATSEIFLEQLTTDLHNTKKINDLDYPNLVLELFDGTEVTYEYDQNTKMLKRNNKLLHPQNIRVAEIFYTPRSAGDPRLIEVIVKFQSHDPRLARAVVERQTTISLRSNRGVL